MNQLLAGLFHYQNDIFTLRKPEKLISHVTKSSGTALSFQHHIHESECLRWLLKPPFEQIGIPPKRSVVCRAEFSLKHN